MSHKVERNTEAMKILAISGSLRAASINSAFCRAAARLAPAPVQVQVFAGLGELALFNPDLELCPPLSVREFQVAVGQANALLIASPEYAHGISGAMKNALDWLVSDQGFVGKPVAIVNTSPRAHIAQAALAEILRTMSAHLLQEASQTLPLLGALVTEEAICASPEISLRIQGILLAMAAARRTGGA
ncbi:NADPH-dependent FMN reductase [Roseateles albus]|uniref:NAD(P)H-dependent oxidoreductase n=1 Tax=Roseateles albus TaxID=2987525 RepID=A0ABT5KDV9_9BURK|nr:NADPH-dependent FMN reductase [Roseateles albus]MDC8772101.1 NAD(P)H-dependent oxidoreductase [Roseateles albus]